MNSFGWAVVHVYMACMLTGGCFGMLFAAFLEWRYARGKFTITFK